MPVRDLNFSVWFSVFDYLPIDDVSRFGLSCKLAHVLFHRQRHAISAMQEAGMTRQEENGDETTRRSPPRFLGRGRCRETVALVSYPRCGNSLVRSLLEQWSGIITGSDTNPMRTLGANLLHNGYMGEGVVDSSVWIVKTHFPERVGYLRFSAGRAVVVVRNPFDSLLSYFHLGMTNTHNMSLSEEAFESLSSVWNEYVASEAETWVAFMKFWLNVKLVQKYPCQFIRYEDLVAGNSDSFQNLTEFLLQGRPPIGVSPKRESKSFFRLKSGYRPRPKGKRFSALQYFSEEQIKFVQETSKDVMEIFGYQLAFSQRPDEESSVVLQSCPCCDLPILCVDHDAEHTFNDTQSPLVINGPGDVRGGNDRFGRGMTALRRSLTENDTKPFLLAT